MGTYEKEASTFPSLEEASITEPQSTEAHYHAVDVFGHEVSLLGARFLILDPTSALLTRPSRAGWSSDSV